MWASARVNTWTQVSLIVKLMLFREQTSVLVPHTRKCVLCRPWWHVPSGSCYVFAAPGTDSPVCFERGQLCCVHFVTGPFLFGFVPVSFVEASKSFAQCDVHPARHGHANIKENGRNLFWVDKTTAKEEMPKDHSVVRNNNFFVVVIIAFPLESNEPHQYYLSSTVDTVLEHSSDRFFFTITIMIDFFLIWSSFLQSRNSFS